MRELAAIAVAAALAAPGCAWGDGEPFGVLDAHLTASFDVPEGRDLGGGWQKLASEYEVSLDTVELTFEPVALIATAGGDADFDPANPPPGFSLCHNGHCHADDGSLVSYEEIAEMLGGGGGTTTAAALEVGVVDLLAGFDAPLACEPSCDLPPGTVTRVRAPVARVRVAGTVRDGLDPARLAGEVAFVLDADLAGDPLAIDAAVTIPIDRDHDPGVTLDLALVVDSRFLDRVDWAAVPPDGDGTLDVGADADAASAVIEDLGELELAANVER